jgi:DNA-directed RNA polymerase subunit RPC12/RpoP
MIMKNTPNNCEYCGSKIFETDRSCVKCGAPILPMKKAQMEKWMYEALTESFRPATTVRSEGTKLLYTYYHDTRQQEKDYYEKYKDRDWGIYQDIWNKFAERVIQYDETLI